MKFSYDELGSHSEGETVEVTLSSNTANVFLVDSEDFGARTARRQHLSSVPR